LIGIRAAVLVASGVVLSCSGTAFANHNTTEIVSTGPNGGNGPISSQFRGASADGSRVFFQSNEQLVAADTDTRMDVYERAGATTILLSTGPAGGNGAFNVSFAANSADGTRVFFRTTEQLVSSDADTTQDLYERSGGATTLLSTGPAGGNGAFQAIFAGISQDGSKAFFQTSESLVAADADTGWRDVYQRSNGTTTLFSTWALGGNGDFDATYAGASRDGARVFFLTDEPLEGSDFDPMQDVYVREGGATSHLSIGPAGGNGNDDFDYDAFFDGASADGSIVWLHTDEVLVSSDTDSANDVYERSGGTISLLSTGPAGGNAESAAFWVGASETGGRVFFDTQEPLVGQDTDSSTDIYERAGGATTLVSTGPDGGNGAFFAAFQGVSVDGSRVFFHTSEGLLAADTDATQDVYERTGGTTTLVSQGPGSANEPLPASYKGASRDGTRVFFDTSEYLAGLTTGIYPDIYERTAGSTTIVSVGPNGGAGDFFAFFRGVSDDGTRLFFETDESLVSSDTDTTQDVYSSSINIGGYVRPLSTGPVRVSLVPAYEPCATSNRTHGPPLAYPSCNPPAQSSGQLTVGTSDANGLAPGSTGFVKLQPVVGNPSTPADEADVRITASLSDVRNKSDLTDYTGELQIEPVLRITDKLNGVAPVVNGTTVDLPFPVTVPCAATASTAIGSKCTVTTTADSILIGAVTEQKRTIWQTATVRVTDGGPDGAAATPDNTLFATQGLFVP
jgi:hypothetical protein